MPVPEREHGHRETEHGAGREHNRGGHRVGGNVRAGAVVRGGGCAVTVGRLASVVVGTDVAGAVPGVLVVLAAAVLVVVSGGGGGGAGSLVLVVVVGHGPPQPAWSVAGTPIHVSTASVPTASAVTAASRPPSVVRLLLT